MKSNLKKFFKRYSAFIFMLIVNVVLGLILPEVGKSSFEITKNNIIEMLSVIPPIFILLGLLDVWVERETMMRYLGKGSGLKGILIAFILGSAAAGPLYASFPVATIMMKKGAGLFNVFIFIGAWATTKIPMLTFEMSSLGIEFAMTRLAINIVGIILIAFITDKMLSKQDEQNVYSLTEQKVVVEANNK